MRPKATNDRWPWTAGGLRRFATRHQEGAQSGKASGRGEGVPGAFGDSRGTREAPALVTRMVTVTQAMTGRCRGVRDGTLALTCGFRLGQDAPGRPRTTCLELEDR
jgi:hypothetical protein